VLRIALSTDSLQSLRTDPQRRTLIRLSLHLVPCWHRLPNHRCVRDGFEALFSTVFRRGLSNYCGDAVRGAGTSTSLMALAGTNVNAEVTHRPNSSAFLYT
jgi:hypothetical protein